MPTTSSDLVSPINPYHSTIGRTDEGVDVTQSDPFGAIASGVISYIDPNFYRGTPAVYETLDRPISIFGRSYSQVYYSETAALVETGQHVAAGDPVIAGGSAELGFAKGNLPAAHAIYHEGDVTPQGKDFLATLQDVIYKTTTGSSVPGGPSLGGLDNVVTGSVDAVADAADAAKKAAEAAAKKAADAANALNPLDFAKRIWKWFLDRLVRLGLLLAGAALIIVGVGLLARGELAAP